MITKDIPLPRLLPNASPSWPERRIRPIKVSINLSITPLSHATIDLPKGETLPERSYVELYTCMGSAGIFRVRSPQDAYGDDITTAELEHAVVEVGDYLVLAKYDEMKAADQAMQTIFGHYRGSKWQLGSVSALGSGQIALQANYNRVLESMLAIMEQKPDCMMAFDFSTSPWTINIVARGTTVQAEGRLSRNVNYAKVSYDDTELCTRAYYEKEATTDEALSGFPVFSQSTYYANGAYVTNENKLYTLPSGHAVGVTWANTAKTAVTDYPTTVWAYVDADTIGTYGLIERTVPTGTDYTAAEALRAANEYISKHKRPRFSVEISLEELSCVTGEPLDTFTIGKLCRLALIDYRYSTTIENHITGLGFPDVYEQPTNITANLADEEDATINFIHDVDAKGGSGGGGGGRKKQDDQFKEYRTRIEQDDYHIGLVSEHADKANNILQAAGIDINSQTGVVIYHTDNENQLMSKINVQAGRIDLVVTGSGSSASINIQAIVDGINQSAVTISADKINLNGYVTTSMLEAAFQDVDQIACDQLSVTNYMTLDAYSVSWQELDVVTSVSDDKTSTKSWGAADGTLAYYGKLVTDTDYDTTKIYYLGR